MFLTPILHLKRTVHLKFMHHVISNLNDLLMYNTKDDILKKVFVHIMKVNGVQTMLVWTPLTFIVKDKNKFFKIYSEDINASRFRMTSV